MCMITKTKKIWRFYRRISASKLRKCEPNMRSLHLPSLGTNSHAHSLTFTLALTITRWIHPSSEQSAKQSTLDFWHKIKVVTIRSVLWQEHCNQSPHALNALWESYTWEILREGRWHGKQVLPTALCPPNASFHIYTCIYVCIRTVSGPVMAVPEQCQPTEKNKKLNNLTQHN